MTNNMIYIIIPTTKERRGRLARCVDALKQNTKYPICIVTYENEKDCTDVGLVPAVHKMISGINGLMIMYNDDVIAENDFVEKLYEAYLAKPENERDEWMFSPWENFHKGENAAFPLCHTNVIKKYLYKGYNHLYSDIELTQKMKMLGRYQPVLEARAHHYHFLENNNLEDETYKSSQALNGKDRELYLKRLADAFEPSNEKVS